MRRALLLAALLAGAAAIAGWRAIASLDDAWDMPFDAPLPGPDPLRSWLMAERLGLLAQPPHRFLPPTT